MGRKREKVWTGECREGKLYGTLEVEGSIKHTSESEPYNVGYTIEFDGISLKEVMEIDAAESMKVRMARLRELPYEEVVAKREQLEGATVMYQDLPSWYTKGQKGRRKIADLSIEELWARMTPQQRSAMQAMMPKA